MCSHRWSASALTLVLTLSLGMGLEPILKQNGKYHSEYLKCESIISILGINADVEADVNKPVVFPIIHTSILVYGRKATTVTFHANGLSINRNVSRIPVETGHQRTSKH